MKATSFGPILLLSAVLSFAPSISLVARTDFAAAGWDAVERKQYDRAIYLLTEALHTIMPPWLVAGVYVGRGDAYAGKGDLERARADYQRALAHKPTTVAEFHNRAGVYRRLGNYQAASADLAKAAEMEPKAAGHLNDIAWLKATASDAAGRNGREAVQFARRACEMTKWKDADYLDTLAAAYAEAGNFEEAIKYQTQVLQMKGRFHQHRPGMEERLALFHQRKPYHRKSRADTE